MLNSLRIFNRVYQKIQLNSYRACIIQANNTFINMYYTLLLANQVIPTAEKQVNNSNLSCCWLTSLWTQRITLASLPAAALFACIYCTQLVIDLSSVSF